jgi:hypothetical protein
MKKLLAALSAAGLVTLGMSSIIGATTATAQVHPSTAVFAVTSSKTTGLSTTKATKLTLTTTGSAKGDAVEAGICNDDASQTSPLSDPGAACTPLDLKTAPSSGKVTFSVTLTPGPVGSDSESGCPQSTSQYGLGIACIVAAADLNTGATDDVPIYFTPPKPDKVTGVPKSFEATLQVKGGFAVAGLQGSSESTLTSGCQAFSKDTGTAWATDPICDDASNVPAGLGGPEPAGNGFAAEEGVEVLENGTPVGQASATYSGVPTADEGSVAIGGTGPVPDPGGASFTTSALAPGKYAFEFVGVGDGTADGSASGVIVKFTVKVAANGNVT